MSKTTKKFQSKSGRIKGAKKGSPTYLSGVAKSRTEGAVKPPRK